jgi:diguanylate cyclase (GGDEF)-like protein
LTELFFLVYKENIKPIYLWAMNNTPRQDKTPEEVQTQIKWILDNKVVTKSTLKRVARILAWHHLNNSQKIIQLQIDHDALDYLARHDILTELPNRRELDLQVQEQITGEEDVAFMIFDLRNFKTINDTYDHTMGDAALELVAWVCREIFKKFGGTIARTGGDEFIGFFPGYPLEQAKQIADEFRILLATKFKKQEPGSEIAIENIPFTAAIGVTSLFDLNGSDIYVKQKKPERIQSDLQRSIAIALKKADLMAKVAKDVDNGIVSDWDNKYLQEAKLSAENKKLRDTFNWIIRHWISDESVTENIQKIRELLLPYLNFHDSLEELRRIWLHINQLWKESTKHVWREFLEILQSEIINLQSLLTRDSSI